MIAPIDHTRRVLLVTVALALLLIWLGALNRYLVVPRLGDGARGLGARLFRVARLAIRGPRRRPDGAAPAQLTAYVAREALVVVAVFTSTAALAEVAPGRHTKALKRTWATACRKAGVPGKLRHDFRRTAVRDLVNAGVSERVAMTVTGHKTRSVFARYHIVSPADLKDVARRLSRGIVSGIASRGTVDRSRLS